MKIKVTKIDFKIHSKFLEISWILEKKNERKFGKTILKNEKSNLDQMTKLNREKFLIN